MSNNRIEISRVLNQSRVSDSVLESKLLSVPLQNPFSTACHAKKHLQQCDPPVATWLTEPELRNDEQVSEKAPKT